MIFFRCSKLLLRIVYGIFKTHTTENKNLGVGNQEVMELNTSYIPLANE